MTLSSSGSKIVSTIRCSTSKDVVPPHSLSTFSPHCASSIRFNLHIRHRVLSFFSFAVLGMASTTKQQRVSNTHQKKSTFFIHDAHDTFYSPVHIHHRGLDSFFHSYQNNNGSIPTQKSGFHSIQLRAFGRQIEASAFHPRRGRKYGEMRLERIRVMDLQHDTEKETMSMGVCFGVFLSFFSSASASDRLDYFL